MRVAGRLVQDILASVGDPESMSILVAVLSTSKSASRIEQEVRLPQSTLYRKVSRLRECGLLMVDRFALRPDGTKEALYLCSFDRLCLRVEGGEIVVDLVEAPGNLGRRWFELFFGRGINRAEAPPGSFGSSF